MSDTFDPYHKWLGISLKDQPPDYYRLLGVDRFESDPDVIASAADQRMLHVRSFQAGKHSAVSQNLLNEIATAKICLLTAEKKAAYDRVLRQTAASPFDMAEAYQGSIPAPPPVPPPSPPPVPPPSPPPVPPPSPPPAESNETPFVKTYTKRLSTTAQNWQAPAAILIAVVLLGASVVYFLGDETLPDENHKAVAKRSTPQASVR